MAIDATRTAPGGPHMNDVKPRMLDKSTEGFSEATGEAGRLAKLAHQLVYKPGNQGGKGTYVKNQKREDKVADGVAVPQNGVVVDGMKKPEEKGTVG